MSNNNMTTTIVRLAFAKGSTEIHAGLTKNNNITLVGELVYSSDLVVSHYNREFEVNGNSCVGAVGTIVFADHETAGQLIDEINSIQEARPVNRRGNRYPFVFLRVVTDGDIIFNKGVGGAPHRLSFLDVECVEVESDAPDEVVQLETRFTSQVAVNSGSSRNSRSAYGTVRYRRPKATLRVGDAAQVKAAREGLKKDDLSLRKNEQDVQKLEDDLVPTFNTKTVDVVEERSKGSDSEDSSDCQDSQQDKLNAIAVAMKAAGMSSAEIAQALKAELNLVV